MLGKTHEQRIHGKRVCQSAMFFLFPFHTPLFHTDAQLLCASIVFLCCAMHPRIQAHRAARVTKKTRSFIFGWDVHSIMGLTGPASTFRFKIASLVFHAPMATARYSRFSAPCGLLVFAGIRDMRSCQFGRRGSAAFQNSTRSLQARRQPEPAKPVEMCSLPWRVATYTSPMFAQNRHLDMPALLLPSSFIAGAIVAGLVRGF
ncbi:hypothetical protein GQ54DRAFT_126155 [Martensiomyces pterosporus]|nr:hypothetical protein GQ54DRAFT_126155 [Martensiomyces pterosporus]